MKDYQYHIFSPYRVCPLGAHVDHQHGLVTGFAIDKGVDLYCVLYISYPIGSDDVKSKIFNLCHMAEVVPGIKKLPEGEDY